MYSDSFTEYEQEEILQKVQTFQPGLFFKNLFVGMGLSYLIINISKISNYIFDVIVNKPGVGKVNTKIINKNKIAIVNTALGDLRVPLVKMPSFDLSMGFFTEVISLEPGLHLLDEFYEFPQHIKLKNLGTSWVTDILKPMTLNGTNVAQGFIISYIDSSVYIFNITDNNFIDYKEIINTYELALEDYDNNLENFSNEENEENKENKENKEE